MGRPTHIRLNLIDWFIDCQSLEINFGRVMNFAAVPIFVAVGRSYFVHDLCSAHLFLTGWHFVPQLCLRDLDK